MRDHHQATANEHKDKKHPETRHLIIALLKDKYDHAEYCSQEH